MKILLTVVAGATFGVGSCLAADVTVNPSGGADHLTIDAAVSAASAGDTIILEAGTYSGMGNRGVVVGKALTITRDINDPPGSVLIDCGDSDLAFEISDTVSLIGLNISNGFNNGSGGAIDFFDIGATEPALTIQDCVFADCNSAGDGGVIYVSDRSTVTITRSVFERNVSGGLGGAISIDPSGDVQLSLESCVFIDNDAEEGGAVYTAFAKPLVIDDCLFTGNQATCSGGALSIDTTSTQPGSIARSQFTNNTADCVGGAVFLLATADIRFANSLFDSNLASSGSAIFTRSNSTGTTLINCTIINNLDIDQGQNANCESSSCFDSAIPNTGGVIYFGKDGASQMIPNVVENSIVWGNSLPDIVSEDCDGVGTDDCELSVTYSDVQGSIQSDAIQTNNISSDPLFISMGMIGKDSPAIDAGDNTAATGLTVDLGGNPRFADIPSIVDTGNGTAPIVDMGAFEVQTPQTHCNGDFDNDGDVDLGDFGVFGAAFGSLVGDSNYNAAADFDSDGDVDLGDFGIFGSDFNRMDCATTP